MNLQYAIYAPLFTIRYISSARLNMLSMSVIAIVRLHGSMNE